MASYFVICDRIYANASRNSDDDYINVVKEARTSSSAFYDLAYGHPIWSNPSENEFVIEISQSEFDLINRGENTLFHDGLSNLPRWQQENEGSGSQKSFGSFADPKDDQTTFTPSASIPDDRLIARIYQNNPVPVSAGIHIAYEELEEEEVTGFVTRYLKLFDPDDNPINTNAQDAKTEIGGKLMIFDFTSGVTNFNVSTLNPGEISFPSNHRYRIIGPSNEKEVIWKVFGRTLEVIN